MSDRYPGRRVAGDRDREPAATSSVCRSSPASRWRACTLAATFLAAGGTLIPRRVVGEAGRRGRGVGRGRDAGHPAVPRAEIRWLPLAAPLVALLLATVAAFAWSYFTEGRQRQFISKAFALSTSPVIAEAISRNPEKLKLGGERREITVMFTDLAGFTDLSETMEVVKLAQVINLYMEAMSRGDRHAGRVPRQVHRRRDHVVLERAGRPARPRRPRLPRGAGHQAARDGDRAGAAEARRGARSSRASASTPARWRSATSGRAASSSYTVLGDAVNLGAGWSRRTSSTARR